MPLQMKKPVQEKPMTLTDFAAIAEIIASIGVILSLLFVGFQMKDSNKQSRMAAIQDSLDYELQITREFIANAELWDRMMSDKEIEEGPEMRKAIQLYNLLMTANEQRYYLYKQGYLVNKSWEARLEVIRQSTILSINNIWRKSSAGRSHAPEFLALMDDIVREKEEGG